MESGTVLSSVSGWQEKVENMDEHVLWLCFTLCAMARVRHIAFKTWAFVSGGEGVSCQEELAVGSTHSTLRQGHEQEAIDR